MNRPIKLEKTGDETLTITREYDDLGQVISEKNPLEATTTYVYNDVGLVTATEIVGVGKNTATYDIMGNMLTKTDILGNVTEYVYDELGRVTKITMPNGGTVEKVYDNKGNVTSETDPHDNISTAVYDGLDRVMSQTDSMGNTVLMEYNAIGSNTKTTDAKGNQTTYTYTKLGAVETLTNPDKTVISYEYDIMGNNTKIIDPRKNTVTMTYDLIGRKLSETDQESYTISYEYDNSNNVKTLTDQLGIKTHYDYDKFNQLKTVTQIDNITAYTYDKLGNLTSQTLAGGLTTSYLYDMFGRKIEDIDNDGGRVYYEYNKASQLVSVIDRNGNVISYTYDSNGQILTETVGDIVTAYEYDLNGNIIETADANSTISYVYDERNLPTTIDYGDDYVVKYVYDKNGNVLKVQTLGMQILYTYDSMNRIKTVTANDLTATYVYDKNGNATNVDVGDSVKSVYTFDKRNMPTLIVNNVGTDVISSTYTYNALGMQTSKTENGETTDYTYDALTRLAKIVEDDGRTTDYTYDKNGNRKTQKVVNGEEVIAEIEYLYNSLGRLMETAETRTDMSEDSNYKYDSNGNQIEVAITTTNITPATAETVEEKVVHNSVVKYDFNGKNQMTHSESAGGRSAEYKYYFNSLRSEKADTKFIYSGKQVLAEVSPDSENINVYGNALLFTIATQITTTKTEIPNPDYIKPVDKEEIPPVNQIAGVTETNKASETSESNVEPTNETTTNPTSESKVEPTNEITTNPTSESKVVDTESETIIVEEKTRETQNLIYNFNGHGDVVRLSNENGVKLNTYKYDAFGNITEKVEAVSNTFFYSGYEYDEETGLYYLRTRYYNPKTARFTTEDTFNGWYTDPLSLNKYTYAHNNPVVYNDPDGESIFRILGGALIGGLIGGAIDLGSQLWNGTDLSDVNWASVGGSAASGAIVGAAIAAPEVGVIFVIAAGAAGNVADQVITKGFDESNDGKSFGEKIDSGIRQVDYVEAGTAGLATGALAVGAKVVAPAIKSVAAKAAKAMKPLTDKIQKLASNAANKFTNGLAKAFGNSADDVAKSVAKNSNKNPNLLSNVDDAYVSFSKGKAAGNNVIEGRTGGKGANHQKPDPKATGDHSTFRRDSVTGKVTNAATYRFNPQNPTGYDEVYRIDFVGGGHKNSITNLKVPTPHIHAKKLIPGKVGSMDFLELVMSMFGG